jgi:hypothetical protein
MYPTDKAARVAGLLYPLMGIPAVFSFMYVPRTLIVGGDAAATANNILASQMLFRLGIVAELIAAVFFLLLVMALYRLLSGVNKNHARLMVGLVLVSVAITFVNVLNNIAALTLFRGADYISVFDKPQRDALAMLFLGLYGQGHAVNGIFWGLWLLPFGLLVMRSRFLPRILGLLLIVNCFAYVAASVTSLLLPAYGNVVFRVSMPALLGELWIMLWLLIKGAKVRALEAPAP